jgi:hypothetical protein
MIVEDDDVHSKALNVIADNSITLDEFPGCRIWNKCKDSRGYGERTFKGAHFVVHRFAWIVSNRRVIPKGLIVRHGKGCSKLCHLPDHLEIGTVGDNNSIDRERDGTILYGESAPMVKITQGLADSIRSSEGSGTRVQRAKKFNTTVNIVTCIDKGVTWKRRRIDDDDES